MFLSIYSWPFVYLGQFLFSFLSWRLQCSKFSPKSQTTVLYLRTKRGQINSLKIVYGLVCGIYDRDAIVELMSMKISTTNLGRRSFWIALSDPNILNKRDSHLSKDWLHPHSLYPGTWYPHSLYPVTWHVRH